MTRPTWKTTFNPRGAWWGNVNAAAAAAEQAGYPFLLWNGRVYQTDTQRLTDFTLADLDPRPDVFRAFEFMAKAHGKQARDDGTPFINHPIRLVRAGDDYSRETGRFADMRDAWLCMLALHDVDEDTSATSAQIAEQFGPLVAEGVRWLTKPSVLRGDLRRADRAAMDLDYLKGSPDYAQAARLLDRADNLMESAARPRSFVLDVYIPETEDMLAANIGAADPILRRRVEDAVVWLRRAMG